MTKNNTQKTSNEKDYQISTYEDLFQLWKDMPVIQKLSDQKLFMTLNDPIRSSILKILREGIIDRNGRKRNFLIANELLEYVNQELEEIDKSIKTSMLYYHLDKLQESNLVKYVFHVEGRHKRKYFGRTAKFYLFGDDDKEKEIMKDSFDPILKLLLHFNPEVSIEEYSPIIENFKTDQVKFSDILIKWMEILKNRVDSAIL